MQYPFEVITLADDKFWLFIFNIGCAVRSAQICNQESRKRLALHWNTSKCSDDERRYLENREATLPLAFNLVCSTLSDLTS